MLDGRPRLRLSAIQGRDEAGLQCPKCHCRHFEVVYTRPAPKAIKRLRQCRHCGHRILTTETA